MPHAAARTRAPIALPLLLALAGIAPPLSAATSACVAPPPGAVYWLGAENSFDDLSGFHNATSVGSGVSFTAGMVGTALHLEGSNARLTTDTRYDEERALRTAFSFELWVRPTAPLQPCAESDGGTCGIGQPWAIFPEHGANSAGPGEDPAAAAGIGVAVGTGGVCVGQHTAFLASCLARFDTPIADWTHVVVVVEDKTPRIYVNGSLEHTGLTASHEFVFASFAVLGNIDDQFGTFSGDLDEVTVYDRALSDAEIAALAAAGASGKCRPDCVVNRQDDAWQGASVTASTPYLSSSTDGLLGGNGGSPEPESLLFADGLPDGTVHSVEWQTEAAVTLDRLAIYAFHDSVDNTQRRFRHLAIEGREIGGDFATIYDSDVVLPYGQGPDLRELMRCPNIRPVHAQQFRAQFVQEGSGLFSGPRVTELDALIHDPIFSDGFGSP